MSGQSQSGTRDAPDVTTLGHQLREEGLLLIDAQVQGEKAGKRKRRGIAISQRIKVTDRMLVTRHLAVLIEAGVDLPRALAAVARQTKNKTFHDILTGISEQIRQGRKFSEILGDYPKAFSDLYISMVAAGEESGQLVESLRVLANQLEKQHKLQSRVRGAMTYPAVVLFAMVLIGIAMIVYVVPQLESVFSDIGAELPPQTRFIFWLSHALVDQWYLFLLGAIAFGFGVFSLRNNQQIRRQITHISMRLPVVGGLIRQVASARLARTLSSLIAAGVPIVKAIEITSRVVGNQAFQTSLEEAARAVEKGTNLHEALSAHADIYPPLVIEMAAVGEESGQLSNVFRDLASFYEEEVDQALGSISSIIEPVLMLVIGGVVGFFVISLMQPMYTLIGQQ
jgi:type IV pilus assembly protein PilC